MALECASSHHLAGRYPFMWGRELSWKARELENEPSLVLESSSLDWVLAT